jgi:hypothetical protein
MIATRGLSLFLGLAFLGGALWGPGIAIDALVGSLALLAKAILPRHFMESFWGGVVCVLGATAILIRGWILMAETSHGEEIFLQVGILAIAILLLLSVFARRAREYLRR